MSFFLIEEVDWFRLMAGREFQSRGSLEVTNDVSSRQRVLQLKMSGRASGAGTESNIR